MARAIVDQFFVCFFLLFLTPRAMCRTLMPNDLNPVVTMPHFESLRRLEGSKKGDIAGGLYQIKRYLNQLGYLEAFDDLSNKDVFDDKLESAIKSYQVNYNLNTTGILDSHTVRQLLVPRCGTPDPIQYGSLYHNTNPLSTSQFSFFPSHNKWNETLLMYKFQSDFPPNLKEPVRHAFEIWSNKTRFYFFELQDDLSQEYADINIDFVQGEHGDGHPFDGPGGVLAHAFAPSDGRMHFDGSENWVDGSLPRAVDIVSVAVHEIGHLLGLEHTYVQGGIMFPYFDYGLVRRTLHEDDIAGIKTLYGRN